MGKRLFVGNLPYKATEDELRAVFSEIGDVADVHIVLDRETGRPRGFAFVSYTTDENAAKAAATLNGRDFGGRPLAVSEARDRGAPPPRSGSGPPRGGPRPAGGAPRPPRPGGPPQEMPPMEEYKETAARPRMKKRKQGGGDSEGRRDLRRRFEEEEERGGSGSWRQWLDDDD